MSNKEQSKTKIFLFKNYSINSKKNTYLLLIEKTINRKIFNIRK